MCPFKPRCVTECPQIPRNVMCPQLPRNPPSHRQSSGASLGGGNWMPKLLAAIGIPPIWCCTKKNYQLPGNVLDLQRVSPNAPHKLGGEVENILRSHNYTGKQRRKRNPYKIRRHKDKWCSNSVYTHQQRRKRNERNNFGCSFSEAEKSVSNFSMWR
ncbi:hypothetical protein TNCV_2466751 [Trichonephila clavipes]|nr:hypothetical protein TNCV_2466751 [Trichonephila clavipes]